MALFAIADLHLGFAANKPMDIFGDQWKDHEKKIEKNWRETVAPEDTVLIAGDISWGMKYVDAEPDLKWLDALPGRKIIIRGNHDYWFDRITRLRNLLPPSIAALQNDWTEAEGCTIAGSRGWTIPAEGYSEDLDADAKIFERERARLNMSLKIAPKDQPVVVMMHFPPIVKNLDHPGFSDILEIYGVSVCVYGHYHGPDAARAVEGVRNGVRYVFCAADGVGFKPVKLQLPE